MKSRIAGALKAGMISPIAMAAAPFVADIPEGEIVVSQSEYKETIIHVTERGFITSRERIREDRWPVAAAGI